MKKYLILIAFISIAFVLKAQKGFTVEGNITGLPDGSIQLKKIYDGKVLYETTAKDGKFTFKQEGKFIGDKVILTGTGIKSRLELYIEPGKIKVEGDVSQIVATGTPSNEANNYYLKEVAPIEKRIKELRTQMNAEKDKTAKDKLQADLGYQYEVLFYPLRKAVAKKFNNTILAAEFLSAGTGELTYTDMKNLIAGLDPKTPENWYTNRLLKRREILRQTDIGQSLPDFTLPDTSGKQFTFSSTMKGKIVLVDFWASWCVPCRQENQNVLKLYDKYNKDGFSVVSVSIDEKRDKWVDAIQHDKLRWYHVSSLVGWDCPVANNLGVAYGMSGVPYTLLVGRDGKVIGHNVRGEKLEEKLAEIFKSEASVK